MTNPTCTVNPSFVYTRYPCDLDDPRPSVDSKGLPVTVDLQTAVKGEVVNRQRESILAVEGELGTKPSGTYTTVKDRLDAMDVAIANTGNPITISLNSAAVSTGVTNINFSGSGIDSITASAPTTVDVVISGGGSPVSSAVIFDTTIDANNIRSDRTFQSPIDNTQVGITNLGSDTSGLTFGAIGSYSTISGGDLNSTNGSCSVISGGYNNIIGWQNEFGSTVSDYSAINGGGDNRIGYQDLDDEGWVETYAGGYNAIFGGYSNGIAFAESSFILGGESNRFEQDGEFGVNNSTYCFISGYSNKIQNSNYCGLYAGSNNSLISSIDPYSGLTVANTYTGIFAGYDNTAKGSTYCGIFSGSSNTIEASDKSFILGYSNTITSSGYSTISGGYNNKITSGSYGFIGSGDSNTIAGGGDNFIGSGAYNLIYGNSNYSSIVNGNTNLLIGGSHNTTSGYFNFIGDSATLVTEPTFNIIFGNTNQAGYYNYQQNTTTETGVTIGGFGALLPDSAHENFIVGGNNVIEGGGNNTITGNSNKTWTFGLDKSNNFVSGAFNLVASSYVTVTGFQNIATGDYSVVQGKNAYSKRDCQLAKASYQFNQIGDAQKGEIILQGQNTDGYGSDIVLQASAATTGIRLDDGQTYDINARTLIVSSTNNIIAAESRARFINDLVLHQTDSIAVIDEDNETLAFANGTGWSVAYSVENNVTINSGIFASIGVMSGTGAGFDGTTEYGGVWIHFTIKDAVTRLPYIGNYNCDFITISGSSIPANNGTYSAYIADGRRVEISNDNIEGPDTSSIDWTLTFLPRAFYNTNIQDRVAICSDNAVLISGLTNMSANSVGRYLTISGAANSDNNGTFKIIAFISPSVVLIENMVAVYDGYENIPDINNGSLSWAEKESRLEVTIPSTADQRDRKAISTIEWREISNTTQIMMGLQPNFDIPDPSSYFSLRPNNTLTDAGSGEVFVTLTSGDIYTSDMVGKYITIKDATDPQNNGLFLITAFVIDTVIKIYNPVAVFPSGNVSAWYTEPNSALYTHKKLQYGSEVIFDVYPPELQNYTYGDPLNTTTSLGVCLRSCYSSPSFSGNDGAGNIITFTKIQTMALSDGYYDFYVSDKSFSNTSADSLSITAQPDGQAEITAYDPATGIATIDYMTSDGSGIMTTDSVGRYIDIYDADLDGYATIALKPYLITEYISDSSVKAYIPQAEAGVTFSWVERKKVTIQISVL